MPQARSEATRQKILDAAIDLFSDVGHSAAGQSDIIERAEISKGALYHHFDSKEAIATAIIEQGADLTREAFRKVCESSSPALENMIHGVFVVTDLMVYDKAARTAEQLTRALAEFNSTAAKFWSGWLDPIASQAKRASVNGDIREDVDPYAVSESILNAMFSAQFLAKTAGGGSNHVERLTRSLDLLLSAIVADSSVDYFREYLARESLRHPTPDPPHHERPLRHHVSDPSITGPSNRRTSPTRPDHRNASAPTLSSWPAPSNPPDAAARQSD